MRRAALGRPFRYPEERLAQLPVFVGAGVDGGGVPFASDVTTGVLCAVVCWSNGHACTGRLAISNAKTNNEAMNLVMATSVLAVLER